MDMAILHSCCFWRTVRKGSYASAIYTLIYFGCSSIMLLQYIKDEHDYLAGKVDRPTGESLLERGEVSPTAVVFNILFLLFSLCLVASSALVVLGLWKDRRYLLLPWIIFMFADVFIEFSHLLYLVGFKRLMFNPIVSVVLTIDFFIMCLNVYCLVCVISQYQEYKCEALNTNEVRHICASNIKPLNNCLKASPRSHTPLSPNTNFSLVPEESRITHSTSEDDMPSGQLADVQLKKGCFVIPEAKLIIIDREME